MYTNANGTQFANDQVLDAFDSFWAPFYRSTGVGFIDRKLPSMPPDAWDRFIRVMKLEEQV